MMKVPKMLSPSFARRTAFIFAVLILLFQVFADRTIANDRSKNAAKNFPATEKSSLKKAEVPAELLAIEKKYVGAKTLEADFRQKDEVKMTGATKQSSGVLMIRHPNQFRWETLKPDKNLLVSDGRKFWFYTPPFEAGERGQVIERKTTEVQSELANALLAGAFSRIRGVDIQKVSPTRFKLVPSEGVAGTVKTAELDIDPKKNVIERLQLEHQGGNKTEIKLENVKLSAKLSDSFFKFVTPPGTDVVRE
jgi:outer membrane lipoprotein carrier protein